MADGEPATEQPPAEAPAEVSSEAPTETPAEAPAAPSQEEPEDAVEPEEAAPVEEEEPPAWANGYTAKEFAAPYGEWELNRDAAALSQSLGYDCIKRNNIHVLADDVVIYCAGPVAVIFNTATQVSPPIAVAVIFNTSTQERVYIPSLDGGGIGAVTVHPSRKYFAIGEKCSHRAPNIYIYEFPSLDIYRVLRDGTEAGYADLDFNTSGSKMASVGGKPDFMLTVWNWETEGIMLRSKAFGQDVYRVVFSKFNEGRLISGGTGHIKLWKMASTFTGLKLKGSLGKFGNVELSDTSAFCEFPDGKAICGTETGQLLVWDGNLIKIEVRQQAGSDDSSQQAVHCHKGDVEFLQLDYEQKEFISAGQDGYIRFWDFDAINDAEAPEDGEPCFFTAPKKEIFVGGGVRVRGMYYSPTQYLIQDMAGAMWKLPHDTGKAQNLGRFHAGAITGMDVSPVEHICATTGDDGTVRIWYYVDSTAQTFCREHEGVQGTCLSWAPKVVDETGLTFLVGFSDGMVRVFTTSDVGTLITLVKVCKPHDAPVTCIEFSEDGLLMATTSADNNIFFFSVYKAYEPLGFVTIPSPVLSLSWRPDKKAILVCCKDGSVLELDTTSVGSQDTSETYELQVDWKEYEFIGFRPLQPKRKKKKDGEDEDGLGEELPKEGEGEEEDEWEDDPDAHAPPMEVGKLLMGRYYIDTMDEGKPNMFRFLLVFDERGIAAKFPMQISGGGIYSCQIGADEPSYCLPCSDGPLVNFETSFSKNWLVGGTVDGLVSIRSTAQPWGSLRIPSHDSWTGEVSAARISFDDNWLISAGTDGNLIVQSFIHSSIGDLEAMKTKAEESDPLTHFHDSHHEKLRPTSLKDKLAAEEKGEQDGDELTAEEIALAEAASKPKEPPVPLSEEEVSDITDSSVYSIQEAKLKTEEDKLIAAAEAQKDVLRGHVAALREELLEQLSANQSAPEAARLQRSEFDVDPEFKRLLRVEGDLMVQQVHKELAWDSERRRILMQKLRTKYLDELAVEAILLHAFETKKKVSSFRTTRLPEELQSKLHEVYDLMKTTVTEGEAGAGEEEGEEGHAGVEGEEGGEEGEGAAEEEPKLEMGKPKALTKEEEKKKKQAEKDAKRGARRKMWEDLYREKPADDYEPPEDVAAYTWADANCPDKKLKMDPDYVVPVEQRVNTEKKRRQMLLMEESVSLIKAEYNERFLGLRDLKRRIIRDIHDGNKRLDAVEKDIASCCELLALQVDDYCPHETRYTYKLDKREFPELRDDYTKPTLERFEIKEKEEMSMEAAAVGGGMGSFGGGEDDDAGEAEEEKAESDEDEEMAPDSTETADDKDKAKPDPNPSKVDLRDRAPDKLTALEKLQYQDNLYRYRHERTQIFRRMRRSVASFDEGLAALIAERFRVQSDLKTTDLRMLVLEQELQLLREFDKKDSALVARQQKKMREKAEIERQLAACKEAADVKKAEAEVLVEKQKELEAEFDVAVPPRHPKREELVKVFRKKIKRRKKPMKDDDEEDYDSEEFDEEEDDDDDDDDESSEEEEMCPDKVEKAVWEKVLELRERRLDHDEVSAEFKAGIDRLQKENGQLEKKEKQATTEQKAIETEIEAFQNEKQEKFNALDVVVMLRLDQIQCLVNDQLPVDQSECIVFTNKGLKGLEDKKKDIGKETRQLQKTGGDIRKQSGRLSREIKIKTAEVADLQAKCTDVQVLKFGKEIDLEAIEKAAVNQEADELREKLERSERDRSTKIQQWDEMIKEAKEEHQHVIQNNTELLKHMGDLTEAQQKLEVALNASGGVMNVDHDPNVEKKAQERAHMMDLVQMQANEIDALKAEINMLRRKGGHVYTPIQKRVASSSMRTKPGTGQMPITAGSDGTGGL